MLDDLVVNLQKVINGEEPEEDNESEEKVDGKDKKSEIDIRMMPPGIMAYVGDGVYELVVRNHFVQKGIFNSNNLHSKVIEFVNATAQADIVRYIEDHLTKEEKIILRRGRNSNAGNVPQNANVSDYRYSTAFEAVIGYLFLQQEYDRIGILISLIEEYIEKNV